MEFLLPYCHTFNRLLSFCSTFLNRIIVVLRSVFSGLCSSFASRRYCLVPWLSAAYIEALYVYVSLSDLPCIGVNFDCALHEFICKIALSKFPSAGKLLSKVIPSIRRGPFEWLMIEKVPVIL
ncbi:hypothetical protein Gasu_32530 isoform 1 [Galdieria sulphuraria]|uniref:Uncharacterized protein n=1 Tax=Galdieria sulphuraria TaxID=130081 RepID=M2XH83_GALSU|nr:hypothetical protein Gasu_32530 isoform 1 [Galdieria sulphuraria]EME29432.1 hypothetical protein Gasu_32530 isoform 1 [Galdieria sulphuraria]|eukprot:XP_005705952.1 hypothetical protein isoform 1 [Galdieria sulphuraria]